MKNNDEMYQSLLSRFDEYQEKKKKRLLIIKRTVPVLACLCIATVLGFGHWERFAKRPDPSANSDIVEISTTAATTADIPAAVTTDTAVTSSSAVSASVTKTTVTGSTTSAGTAAAASAAHTRSVTSTSADTRTTASTARRTGTTAAVATPPVTTTSADTQTTAATGIAVVTTSVTTIAPNNKDNPNIREVKFGYPEEGGSDGNYGPSTSVKILMKCMSFCENGKKLSVDVAMADGSLRPIYYDLPRNYVYEAYACGILNFQDIEDDRININGEEKGYKREYLREEVGLFDIKGQYNDYDLYHHEITEVDFSGYEAGSTGRIRFSFMSVYVENPLNPSTMGSSQFMYFYVGEEGTSVSNISIEDAIDNYETITKS